MVQVALPEPNQQAIQAHLESQLVDSLRYCNIKSNKSFLSSGSSATLCLGVQKNLETKRKQQKRAVVRSSHKHGGTDSCQTVEAAAAGQFQTSKVGEWEKTRGGKQQRLKKERRCRVSGLDQGFSTFLMLWPLDTLPYG